jgi:hypothetical protein
VSTLGIILPSSSLGKDGSGRELIKPLREAGRLNNAILNLTALAEART